MDTLEWTTPKKQTEINLTPTHAQTRLRILSYKYTCSLSLTLSYIHSQSQEGGTSQSTTSNNIILPFTVAGVIDEDEGRPDRGGSCRSTSWRLMWNNNMWTMFTLDPCCCGTSNLMARTCRADALVGRLASESNLIGFWVSEPFGSAELYTHFRFGRSQNVFLVKVLSLLCYILYVCYIPKIYFYSFFIWRQHDAGKKGSKQHAPENADVFWPTQMFIDAELSFIARFYLFS